MPNDVLAVVKSKDNQEFSGVAATSPLDAATGRSATSSSPSSGTVTPTVPGDLAVGFIAGHASKQAITVTSPGSTTQPQRPARRPRSRGSHRVPGAHARSTRKTFTGSLSTAMYWASGIAMFRAAIAPPDDFSITAAPGTATVIAGQRGVYRQHWRDQRRQPADHPERHRPSRWRQRLVHPLDHQRLRHRDLDGLLLNLCRGGRRAHRIGTGTCTTQRRRSRSRSTRPQ